MAKQTLQQQFGGLVRRLRLDAALSQEDLADKASLHATYIGRLERGERMPSLLVLQKLAKAFDLSLTGLMREFEGEDDEVPAPPRGKRRRSG